MKTSKMGKPGKAQRLGGGIPTGKGIGSPLGRRGINGAYGKPMAMVAPTGKSAHPRGHISGRKSGRSSHNSGY